MNLKVSKIVIHAEMMESFNLFKKLTEQILYILLCNM